MSPADVADVRGVIDQLPPLTDEQCRSVAELLRSARLIRPIMAKVIKAKAVTEVAESGAEEASR